ncbi:hypothetical protein CVT25_005281 [Psilocybe cyanescens]|uniref:Uncharacterized protein n=1 Tax=Psilocybe cyanescens TaxID=93625 RepID=A0A409WX01_PSICY|nr:hypothetical protein CVT25_005281 [Psilocybe cyanescens]
MMKISTFLTKCKLMRTPTCLQYHLCQHNPLCPLCPHLAQGVRLEKLLLMLLMLSPPTLILRTKKTSFTSRGLQPFTNIFNILKRPMFCNPKRCKNSHSWPLFL